MNDTDTKISEKNVYRMPTLTENIFRTLAGYIMPVLLGAATMQSLLLIYEVGEMGYGVFVIGLSVVAVLLTAWLWYSIDWAE